MRLADGSAQSLPGDRGPAVRRPRRRRARADAARAGGRAVYELPEEEQGEPIPLTLDAALDALEADATLCDAMGSMLVETFLTIKRFELERYHRHVSDWDLAEYAHHL